MSVWTDFTEKVEAGSKVVADKAKELSSLAALKAQIVQCDNTISKSYKDIGKAYYEAHKDDESLEYAELMITIKEQLDKKEELNCKIAELKDSTKTCDEVIDKEDVVTDVEAVSEVIESGEQE